MIPGFPELEIVAIKEWLSTGQLLSFVFPISTAIEGFSPELTRLSEEEQFRFARFKKGADARAFFMGRFFIRAVLEGYLGVPSLELELTDRGKPYCPQPHSPRFNLSHGGNWLLISFCLEADLGVDLEDLRRNIRAEALAKRYFSPAERQQFSQAKNPQSFMRIWTRKEARLKASGEGLTVPISERCTLTEPGWQYDEVKADSHIQGVVAYAGAARPHKIFKRSIPDLT